MLRSRGPKLIELWNSYTSSYWCETERPWRVTDISVEKKYMTSPMCTERKNIYDVGSDHITCKVVYKLAMLLWGVL